MLNLRFLGNILIIAGLVLLQVFVFDKMAFKNMALPAVYIIFILVYPPQRNRYLFLFLCFLLGWGVDIFQNTGGINAFACISIGLLARPLIRIVSGARFFEVEEFRFSDFNAGQWFIYCLIMVVVHQFLYYFIESFSFANMIPVLLKTVYSSAFTLIFVYSYLVLFRKRERR